MKVATGEPDYERVEESDPREYLALSQSSTSPLPPLTLIQSQSPATNTGEGQQVRRHMYGPWKAGSFFLQISLLTR